MRTRLTLLAALAVAATVVLVSLAAWLLIRDALLGQVDAGLRAQAGGVAGQQLDLERLRQSRPYVADDPNATLVQVLTGDGTRYFPASQGAALPTQPADLAVARGASGESLRDVRYAGDTYRLLTVPAGRGQALQLARSLYDVQGALARFALLLGLVSAAGVAVAAGLGRTVARAGLAPVDRLTAAAERVAVTQDLNAAIDVSGDDEVARLARSLNAMLGALASARAAQRRLVEDAGHELRTPLTSLRTNIELLLRAEERGGLPEAERRLLLRDLRGQMVELTDLTAELVTLARDDTAPPEQPRQVDLAELVTAAVERVRVRLPGLDVQVRVSSVPALVRPAGLERAVVNLLDNAAKWSPPGAPVSVRLDRSSGDPSWAVIAVADRGPGFDAADLPHVFERFWRAPAARALPGSGLGLAIVRQSVEADGGAVRASSRPEGGALVELRLPARAPAAAVLSARLQALGPRVR